MPRPKRVKQATSSITGDLNKSKSMVLSLDNDIHAVVKHISETTDVAQPKVVSFILSQTKDNAETFVRQLKQIKIEKERQELQSKAEEIKKRLHQLQNEAS